MERLTVTAAENLQPGDRFYKRSERGKKTYEVTEQTESYTIANELCLFKNIQRRFFKSTMVIFLRHTKDIQNEISKA